MDPWSSDAWAEPAAASPRLQPTDEHAHPTQIPASWPLPDLSLPNWDNPSPPKTPPLAASSSIGALPQAASTQSRLELDPVSIPIETLTINTQHISSPASSSQSVFKTPDSAGSDKWAQSNQSPVDKQPGQMTSSAIAAPARANPSHPTPPDPDPEPERDLDRWGTFTQTDLPPISSTIPFADPEPPSFPDTSHIQSGWDGETHLCGWDDGLAADHSLPSLASSISVARPDEDVQNDLHQGWSPPPFSDPDHSNHHDTSGDAWGPSNPEEPGGISSNALAGHQLAAQQGHDAESHVEPDDPAMHSNLRSAASPGGELAAATVEAFQAAMSRTAQAATNVMKSANSPGRFFPSAGAQSVRTQSSLTGSPKPEKSINSTNNASWGDLSTLEASKPDAVGNADAPKTAQQREQQEQKRRTGFFAFWSSKSPPPASTPASLQDPKMAGGSSAIAPLGTHDTHMSSLKNRRGSVSSLDTPSPAWPAPSPASANPPKDTAPSVISRLFGRIGPRSNHASIGTSTDDHCEITAPSTELSDNDLKFLDSVQTVPIEPKIVPYDDFPITSNSLNAKNKNPQPETGLFDFLSDKSLSPKAVSPHASQRPTSTSLSSFSASKDPFEFLDSLSRDSAHQKRNLGDQRPSSARLSPPPHLVSLPSHASRSGAAAQKNVAGDDLDELFSHFQCAELSSETQAECSPTPTNPAPLRGFQKPLGAARSVPPPGPTQVRMASTGPKPTLPRDSHSLPAMASSSKVPILAPPPSSSRPVPSGPIPLIPPPAPLPNKHLPPKGTSQPAFSPPPPPPPPQNVTTSFSFQPPKSMAPSHYTVLPPTTAKPGPPRRPTKASNQPGGLSKEDLRFFDSLI